MMSFTPEQVLMLLQNTNRKQTCSDWGYFSKPFRVNNQDEEFIVKTFLPVANKTLVDFIIQNHNEYKDALLATGIKLPETYITSIEKKKKHQIIIIQQPFKDEELARGIIAKASLKDINGICAMLYADILKFWNAKGNNRSIGFHPSLRNYALRNRELYYFDTFPPMLMDQMALNRIIIAMSPYGRLIKKLVPPSFINRVSDEYYRLDTMFIGLVGSCCRLRPELSAEILNFSCEYVKNSGEICEENTQSILLRLKAPPNLSKLWLTVRKLSGNSGKPNV